MINAAFIIMLGAFSGMMVGLALCRRDRERELYYGGLVKLCAIMANNVSFRSDKIASVIGEAEVESKALKQNLSEYISYLSGGELKLSCGRLNKSELAAVSEFFTRLGRYDSETQLSELKRNELEFRQKFDEIKQKNVKQGNLYAKLGLLFGALVGILLV